MATMQLTIPQRQQFHAALMAAFPDYDNLELMTGLYLGVPLASITPEKPLPNMILKLIMWAEARGRVPELIDAARNAMPTNPQLLAFVALLNGKASAPAPRSPFEAMESFAPPVPAPSPPRPALERAVIQAVTLANVEHWRAGMTTCERAVCRVEFPIGTAKGTGVLVAPDLVITAYHVLEPIITDDVPWPLLHFRFGYRADETGGGRVHQGQTFGVAGGNASALIAHSPTDQLDYAIVRLAEPAGTQRVDNLPDAPLRGYLAWHAHTLAAGDAMFIVQHPDGAPLQVTSGAFLRETARYVHYQATNTRPKSSGAPCFTSDWKLVALHRSRDDRDSQGVPFEAIAADVATTTGISTLLTMATV